MRRFPGKPVFLALGNNDSICGDYMLAPDGRFLADTQRLVRRMLRVGESEGFDHGWDVGRGYDVANGTIPRLRMIFLNSIFFSPHYDDACATAAPADPGLDAIAWLAGRLSAAERAGEKVWVLMHIPPGADAFATLRAGACPTGLRAMWSAPETDRFLELIGRHAHTVTAVYAGPRTWTSFGCWATLERSGGFVLGTPAISPIFGQNPGFHVYDTDAGGRLVDRETWALGDLSSGGPVAARVSVLVAMGSGWLDPDLDGGSGSGDRERWRGASRLVFRLPCRPPGRMGSDGRRRRPAATRIRGLSVRHGRRRGRCLPTLSVRELSDPTRVSDARSRPRDRGSGRPGPRGRHGCAWSRRPRPRASRCGSARGRVGMIRLS